MHPYIQRFDPNLALYRLLFQNGIQKPLDSNHDEGILRMGRARSRPHGAPLINDYTVADQKLLRVLPRH